MNHRGGADNEEEDRKLTKDGSIDGIEEGNGPRPKDMSGTFPTKIIRRIKGWTEEWEKERHEKNDTVLKAMFVNKYKDTMFDLLYAENNTFYVGENEIAWVQGRDGGWTIFGVCDIDGVEDKKLTPILAISLIRLKRQKKGAVVQMSHPGSKEEKVWGSDEYDNN